MVGEIYIERATIEVDITILRPMEAELAIIKATLIAQDAHIDSLE